MFLLKKMDHLLISESDLLEIAFPETGNPGRIFYGNVTEQSNNQDGGTVSMICQSDSRITSALEPCAPLKDAPRRNFGIGGEYKFKQ
jgi:hypothetical protein